MALLLRLVYGGPHHRLPALLLALQHRAAAPGANPAGLLPAPGPGQVTPGRGGAEDVCAAGLEVGTAAHFIVVSPAEESVAVVAVVRRLLLLQADLLVGPLAVANRVVDGALQEADVAHLDEVVLAYLLFCILCFVKWGN